MSTPKVPGVHGVPRISGERPAIRPRREVELERSAAQQDDKTKDCYQSFLETLYSISSPYSVRVFKYLKTSEIRYQGEILASLPAWEDMARDLQRSGYVIKEESFPFSCWPGGGNQVFSIDISVPHWDLLEDSVGGTRLPSAGVARFRSAYQVQQDRYQHALLNAAEHYQKFFLPAIYAGRHVRITQGPKFVYAKVDKMGLLDKAPIAASSEFDSIIRELQDAGYDVVPDDGEFSKWVDQHQQQHSIDYHVNRLPANKPTTSGGGGL